MEIILLPQAIKDRDYWLETKDKIIMKKISALLKDIQMHPFTGIGKPEALKYELSGKWSRRISIEHRLIYFLSDNIIYIYSMRFHY